MTPGEEKLLVRSADLYKMSLGKTARYREEALAQGALVFQSETDFYDAVAAGDEAGIRIAGAAIRNSDYPRGGAPERALAIWRGSIETFRALPERSLVVHWESDQDHLHWGIAAGKPFQLARRETNEFGQEGYIFHRSLLGGWRRASIGGVPLSNIHPAARDLAINRATLNRVRTDADYFRALILDEDTTGWEERSDWQAEAARTGWHPKPRALLLDARRSTRVTAAVREVADHFEAEVRRMAATAVQTSAYANGQIVLVTVKAKDIGFTRSELEDEIAALLAQQDYRCALTGYSFRKASTNPHLKPSLDRKDSSLGYVPGNLQVVTRAANFFKSASDEADWKLKAKALEHMAVALQQRAREGTAGKDMQQRS